MKVYEFAQSSLGLPVRAYRFENGGPEVLILGGIHGDEIEGVIAAEGVLQQIANQKMSFKLNLTIVPMANPDGLIHKTRGNWNGVDLNRNLPTKDWSPEIKTPRYHPGPSAGSEPENQGLMNYISQHQPKLILSLHSWHPVLNVNGNCLAVAQVLAQETGYKIDAEIGYPTPGCLGTYAGLERNSPTLTYEIERGLKSSEVLRVHVPAILKSLKVMETQ